MKNLLLCAMTLGLLATSCKKDSAPPPPDLGGTNWTGTANIPGLGVTDKALTLKLNPDATLSGTLNTGAPFAITGTWMLSSNSSAVNLLFTLATVPGSYVGSATLTTKNTKMESGTATNATTPTANLNFTVTKM